MRCWNKCDDDRDGGGAANWRMNNVGFHHVYGVCLSLPIVGLPFGLESLWLTTFLGLNVRGFRCLQLNSWLCESRTRGAVVVDGIKQAIQWHPICLGVDLLGRWRNIGMGSDVCCPTCCLIFALEYFFVLKSSSSIEILALSLIVHQGFFLEAPTYFRLLNPSIAWSLLQF